MYQNDYLSYVLKTESKEMCYEYIQVLVKNI